MKHDIVYVQSLLQAHGVASYKITQTDTASYEMFFVKGRLETVRSTDTRDLSVTVYVDHDGKTGSSTVQVYPSQEEAEMAEAIASALRRARLVFDEPYDLPTGGTEVYEDDGALTKLPPEQIGADIAEAVFGAPAPEGAAVNALEIFVKDSAVRVMNSRGIDKTRHKRTASLEYIPTYNGKDGSVELYQFDTLAVLDTEALRASVSEHMADVAARMEAKAPTAALACPVLLPIREFRSLVRELAHDLSYQTVYNRSNLRSVGDAVQPDCVGDAMTITACRTVEGSPLGAPFDGDGTTLVDRVLIRDGVCVGRFGSHRFARYLGEEPTGQLPCLCVAAGSVSAETLRAEAHLACVSMSGLQVDLFNDYIGGEVRLAYYFDGKTRIPVTGISISGKLSEALRTLTMSTECATEDSYHGPVLARIDGLQIF